MSGTGTVIQANGWLNQDLLESKPLYVDLQLATGFHAISKRMKESVTVYFSPRLPFVTKLPRFGVKSC